MTVDLHRLARGRGVQTAGLRDKLGPELATICGLHDEKDDLKVKQRLLQILDEGMAGLPPEDRLAASAALALHPNVIEQRFLRMRLAWLAEQIDRNSRTAQRRVHEAFVLLATALATASPAPDHSSDADRAWYVNSLKTTLLLKNTGTRAVEQRRIVATGRIDSITHRMSLPAGSSEQIPVEVELLHGGLIGSTRTSTHHSEYDIILPESLKPGDEHEYSVELRIPAGLRLDNRYLCVPIRRYDRFTLRVRFDIGRLPHRVWRVDGAVGRSTDAVVPSDVLLHPDRFGDVFAQFRDLRAGCGYGLQWDFGTAVDANEARARVTGGGNAGGRG